MTEGICFVSLSLLLSNIILFKMPFGGSVTLGHTLPLVILAHRRGFKTSIFANLSYCLIHLFISFKVPPAKSLCSFISIILIDYILPYFLMSIVFSFNFVSRYKICIRIIISFVLKIIMASISGVLLWSDYIPFTCNIWIYSIIYNCMYLVPECIITVLIGIKLFKFLTFEKKNINYSHSLSRKNIY